MKIFQVFVIIFLLFGCTTQQKQKEEKPVSWAIKFADAVMTRYDSLIYYNGNKPKYEYDYAFLGAAIDKLGDIDKKYSDYMQAYIDYFVQSDGTIKGYKLSDYN